MSLKINQISKSFDEKHVLGNITFTVENGEFISIIGPSGSGKSTLFGIIGGIITPNSGDISTSNQSILNKTGMISYMPQEDSLFPWRTVLDNVLLGQELYETPNETQAKNMLEAAGLKDVIHAFPHELSGGMRQRVSFIRALMCPQDILCLDEPFSALDEFTRTDMQKWLLNMWTQYQQSILFITHNIEEALFMSDKIIILSHSPAEIKEIITVPFERPREESLRLTEEFLTWKKKVIEVIDTLN